MRNLKTPDLFKLSRIIKKMDIKPQFDADVPAEQIGSTMLLMLLENAGNAEEDILKFIADIAEVDVKEVKEDEFEILGNVAKHLQKQPKLNTFLSQAFLLTK